MASEHDLQQQAFSVGEYRRRVVAVQELMAQRGLDLLLCHNLANICYLSGFQTLGSYGYGQYALVTPASGDPVLFTSDFESHNARIFSWLAAVRTYGATPEGRVDAPAALAAAVRDLPAGGRRLGFEAGHFAMTIEQHRSLYGRLSDYDWIEATDLVDRIKAVKSAEEIAVMRRAAALTTQGMDAGLAACAAGRSDNDVAAAIYETVIRGGGELFSLQPIVTAGRRSGIPHSTFRRHRLAVGDVVFIEVSAAYERYAAPCMRCASLGPPAAEVQRAYDACRASVECLLELIGPGDNGRAAALEAGRRLRGIAPGLVWHGFYGYSVGLTFPPACSDCVTHNCLITEGDDMILQPGMVFHASTSLREVGCYGTTVGDTILVTEAGCEPLTQCPRSLRVC